MLSPTEIAAIEDDLQHGISGNVANWARDTVTKLVADRKELLEQKERDAALPARVRELEEAKKLLEVDLQACRPLATESTLSLRGKLAMNLLPCLIARVVIPKDGPLPFDDLLSDAHRLADGVLAREKT